MPVDVLHDKPSNHAGYRPILHVSVCTSLCSTKKPDGAGPAGIGAAAGGEHNKKLTETPHRLNTAQRFLNDLLTRRMQSRRARAAPDRRRVPFLFSACPRFVLAVFTGCHLLVIVLFTWPATDRAPQSGSASAASVGRLVLPVWQACRNALTRRGSRVNAQSQHWCGFPAQPKVA